MKTKNLLKKAFLLLALMGGVNSAWSDEQIFHWAYNNTTSVQTITNGTALGGTTGGTLTPGTTNNEKAFSAKDKISSYADGVPNDMKAAGTAGTNAYYLKNGSGALYLAVVLTSGTFQAGDVVEICGTGNWGVSTVNSNGNKDGDVISQIETNSSSAFTVASGVIPQNFAASNTLYFARSNGTTNGICAIKITRPSTPPAAISFSPAEGSIAEGTSITLTSLGASSIVYQWGASAVDGNGDWTSVETYSDSNKPVVPAAGSTNTVLSVKASNANGDTYGSASYTPVKMAMKTIYSFADGIGSQTIEAASATIGESSMSISNTSGCIKLTAATDFQFKNGDAIEFSGSVGNTSKDYGIYYGRTENPGTRLYVAAGQPCYVSGTLTLDAATSDLYIKRYGGTTTNFTTFTIRRQMEAISVAFNGVKLNGSTAVEDDDYTMEGNVITLTADYTAAPSVYLVNHIVFADESVENQNVLVSFGNPDGTYFTGTAVIDGTTYTVKAPCGQINALKVEYKDGETTVKEEHLDVTGLKVGASYTVPFRMYVEKDGALYQTTKNGSNPYYGDAVTLEYNTTVTKSVSSVDLGGGTLVLCEDLDGKTGNNADVRASNCSSYDNTQFTSEEDLPAGKYTFIVKAYSRNRGSSVKVGDKQVFTIAEVGNNGWTDKTFTDVIVPTAGKLALVQGASSTDPVDIIIAIRTGDATTSINLNASGYATYSTYYDVAISGAKAYTAELDFANETITCKEIGSGKVPAGNGVLLFGEANAEVTLTPTADAAALGTNNLKATTNADGTLVTKGSNTYYALSGDTFKEYTGDNFVHHKAFFEVKEGVVQARNFTIVFDEESTGINEVKHGAISNNRFYNPNGQEVAQPTKGLYIMNGKKVIIK